jgi:hypothetical protein
MTRTEKTQHRKDYKSCFRKICVHFDTGDYRTAAYTHEIIKGMCLLTEGERVNIEKKILKDYKIDISEFVDRVVLMNF